MQAQLDALEALPDPYTDLQARLAPAADTAEIATTGPWGFREPGRTAETADVTPEPAPEDGEDIAPSTGTEPTDPAHGPGDQEPAPDPSPTASVSDERTENGPGQDPHTSDPRSEDAPGNEPDARDPHPEEPGDLDPADGDDGDDRWRRRDERGQPIEPDPPIWG